MYSFKSREGVDTDTSNKGPGVSKKLTLLNSEYTKAVVSCSSAHARYIRKTGFSFKPYFQTLNNGSELEVIEKAKGLLKYTYWFKDITGSLNNF